MLIKINHLLEKWSVFRKVVFSELIKYSNILTTFCLELRTSCYCIYNTQICPICKKEHWYLEGHWIIDSQGSEKYYLICNNIKEPGIPLVGVLQSYSVLEVPG